MGGEFGLRLCWLWFDLGSGQLPVTASLAAASVASSAVATATLAALTSPAALVAASYRAVCCSRCGLLPGRQRQQSVELF